MLRTLTIRNFRSHTETVLDFAGRPIKYIGGTNGAGKSSIGYAARMLFTDRCPVVDGRGTGKDLLVRSGAQDYELEGVLEDGRSFTRRARTAMGLGKTKLTDLNSEIESTFGSKALLDTLLGGSFFALDENSRRNLLLTASGVILTQEAFTKHIDSSFDELPHEDEDKKALRGAIIPTLSKLDLTSVEGLTSSTKMVGQLLTEANREVKEHTNTLESLTKLGNVAFDADEAEGEGKKLRSAHDVALGALQQAQRACDNSADDVLRADLEKYEAQLADKAAGLTGEEIQTKHEEAKASELSARNSRDAYLQAARDYETHQRTILTQLEKVEVVEGGKCPTCTQEVTDDLRAEIANRLQAEAASFDPQIRKAREDAAALDPQIAELSGHAETWRALHEIVWPAAQRCREALAKVQSSEAADIVPLQKDYDKAKSVLDAWQAEFGDLLPQAKLFKESSGKLEIAKLKAEALDKLRDFIGTYRNSVVTDKLAAFMKHVNEYAEVFGLSFFIDTDTLEVTTLDGLQYSALSEGEQIRVDTTFRVALAKHTGADLIVVDRLDALDDEGRLGLLTLLGSSGLKAILLSRVDGVMKAPEGHPQVEFLSIRKENGSSVLAAA